MENPVAIDMRHTKMSAEDAALLSGELKKPSWQSKNEGIHERVSFEDSIWGFDLAGGSYYKTPLRVVGVKKGSRAEKAGIRLGDKLKRINDIETSTLTIQEAHEIIIESGIHLKIAVTAPEDEEDSYFCYQDALIQNGIDEEAERRRLEELERRRHIHARVRSDWSLQWPWVSKRRVIYRESNCFMVPSKYESKHRDKFPMQPVLRLEDDVVLQNVGEPADPKLNPEESPLTNGALKVETPTGNGEDNDSTMMNATKNEATKYDHSKTSEQLEQNGANHTVEVDEKDGSEVSELSEHHEDFVQADVDEESEDLNDVEDTNQPDDVANEALKTEVISKTEEENILNNILSDNDNTINEDER